MSMSKSGRANRHPQAMPSSIAGTISIHATATGRKIDRLAVRMIFLPSKAKYLGIAEFPSEKEEESHKKGHCRYEYHLVI